MAMGGGNYEEGTLVYYEPHGTINIWTSNNWEGYEAYDGEVITAYTDDTLSGTAQYIYENGEWSEYVEHEEGDLSISGGAMYQYVSGNWVLYTPSNGTVAQDTQSESYWKYVSGSWESYTPSEGDVAIREDGKTYQYDSNVGTWTRYYDYDENHLVRYKDLREIASRLIEMINEISE